MVSLLLFFFINEHSISIHFLLLLTFKLMAQCVKSIIIIYSTYIYLFVSLLYDMSLFCPFKILHGHIYLYIYIYMYIYTRNTVYKTL